MANIEYINQYMTPFYISATNVVTPLATIPLDKLYTIFNQIYLWLNIILDIVQITIQTTIFILKEGILALLANTNHIFTNLTLEKIIYIVISYNILMILVLDNQRKKITEQKEIIESIEKNITFLKKTERMREDFNELWLQDVRLYHEETNKKMLTMEKKIKKLEKDLKQYE